MGERIQTVSLLAECNTGVGETKLMLSLARKKMRFQCSKASNPTLRKFCLLSQIFLFTIQHMLYSNYTSIWMMLPPLGDLICIRIVPVYHFSIISEFA